MSNGASPPQPSPPSFTIPSWVIGYGGGLTSRVAWTFYCGGVELASGGASATRSAGEAIMIPVGADYPVTCRLDMVANSGTQWPSGVWWYGLGQKLQLRDGGPSSVSFLVSCETCGLGSSWSHWGGVDLTYACSEEGSGGSVASGHVEWSKVRGAPSHCRHTRPHCPHRPESPASALRRRRARP